MCVFVCLFEESPQIINLQTKSIYLDKFKSYSILVIWHLPPKPIHPPTHPPLGDGVSTDHKSSNRISLFWLAQELFYFCDLTPQWNHIHTCMQEYTYVCTLTILCQFCLKIYDLWILLHLWQLEVMCIWRSV